jgi:lipoyl(octanoyl) transferase
MNVEFGAISDLVERQGFSLHQENPTTNMSKILRIRYLGLDRSPVQDGIFKAQPYLPVWAAMQDFTSRRTEVTRDELWILTHEPVFTQGQSGKPEHILQAGNIPVIHIDRGGQVTYHGPGQLIVYLLIDVRRVGLGVRELVEQIEGSVIDVLAAFGIHGEGQRKAPGVYVNGAKIAALGLRIRQGRSYHGLSFNIDMDLAPFGCINPCGYSGMRVTQLRDLVAADVDRRQLLLQTATMLSTALVKRLKYAGTESGPLESR